MSKALFTLTLLASALTLPLTAHADPMDLVTFNFSVPAQFRGSIDFSVTLPASPTAGVTGDPHDGLCGTGCFFDILGGSTIYDFENAFTPGETTVEYASYAPCPVCGPPEQPMAYTLFFGPNLFTDPLTDPTFLTGTFDFNYVATPQGPNFPGTITITPESVATTPEPSTLALLTTGIFGLIAVAPRRKRAHHFFN
jgi:PEP-CTERM motif